MFFSEEERGSTASKFGYGFLDNILLVSILYSIKLFLRAFSKGGFADLNKVHLWNLDYIKKSPQAKKFKELEDELYVPIR